MCVMFHLSFIRKNKIIHKCLKAQTLCFVLNRSVGVIKCINDEQKKKELRQKNKVEEFFVDSKNMHLK